MTKSTKFNAVEELVKQGKSVKEATKEVGVSTGYYYSARWKNRKNAKRMKAALKNRISAPCCKQMTDFAIAKQILNSSLTDNKKLSVIRALLA